MLGTPSNRGDPMKLQARTPVTAPEPPLGRLLERMLNVPDFPEITTLESRWLPPVDVSETAGEYVVRMDAPGFHKENLDINLDGNVLTLSGRRETRKDEETLGYIWREREEGKFVRSIRMPEALDPGKVTAAYQDGILTVRIQKANPTVSTKVAIK